MPDATETARITNRLFSFTTLDITKQNKNWDTIMSKEAATALFLCTSMDLVVVRKLSKTLSDEIRIVVNMI